MRERGVVAPLVPSFLRTGLRVPQDEREEALFDGAALVDSKSLLSLLSCVIGP
jgi:hypothetical protein